MVIRNTLIPPPKQPVAIDPIEEYTKPKKAKLLLTYESDINMNANIDPNIYDKKTFSELMKYESNDTERLWKTRILYDSTPRGPILMYYDMYRQGFAYYAEQNSIPYSVLNAMAMKYVTTFFCRDLFFDETTITEERMSPLYKVFNVDEKKVKPKTECISNEKNPFAKLKNYKMEPQNNNTDKGIDTDNKENEKKKEDEKEKKENERPKIKNKFISLGKTYNFSILQRVPKAQVNKPTVYDGMFSYKDFKQKQGNQAGEPRFPLDPSFNSTK
jgi:hypothetical protein